MPLENLWDKFIIIFLLLLLLIVDWISQTPPHQVLRDLKISKEVFSTFSDYFSWTFAHPAVSGFKEKAAMVLKLVFLISVSKQFWDKTSTTTIYLASQPLWNNVHPHPISDQPNWYLFVILCIQSDVTHSTASSISTILKIIPFW